MTPHNPLPVLRILVTATLFVLCVGSARAAELRHPASSRILEDYDAGPARSRDDASELDLTGYRRSDMIGYIYQGKFELVPATGLNNIRYFSQTVADLASRCPNLDLDRAKYQIVPYLASGVTDLVKRFQSGQLSQSEVLQAAWMAMLGLTQHWACRYDPSRESRELAQAQCDAAAGDSRDMAVLPSLDAAIDVTVFLGRHACTSREARHLSRQLIDFGRTAHARMHFTETMPGPGTPEGIAYGRIFENCARRSIDSHASAWCGCYVRTLHALNPGRESLADLANNPFVDGSTYMSWVATNVAGGGALFDCASTLRGQREWSETRAPRPTACLTEQRPGFGGEQECRYRSAWGEFTMTAAQCPAEISSRQWGYREVDCGRSGAVADVRVGPREWRSGAYTMIDYEGDVAADFVPPLPADARSRHPLQVRFLKRSGARQLKSMSVSVLTELDLMMAGLPPNLSATAGGEIASIDQEGALVLKCTYNAQKGTQSRFYWFESTPGRIQRNQVDPAVSPFFARIGGGITTCPARFAER